MLLEIPPPDVTFLGKQKDAWHYLNDKTTTEIFYGGAAGGGKSFLGCVWHITNRARYPGTRGLIGRDSITTLEQSTLKTFFDVCGIMGYTMGVDYFYNANKHIITWVNGSETFLKDLFLYPRDPNFTSLGSTEFTDAFIDEGTEITLKAFDIVNSRLRYKLKEYGIIPKILVTCNPSPGWIKDTFLTDPATNTPVILKPYQKFVKALVTDNPDADFVRIYSDQLIKMHSEYDRERLLYGNWDVHEGVQNPFAFQFDPAHHTGDVRHNPNKQLYISIDFNLNPFAVTFWHFWQDMTGFHLHGIDEAEIENGSIPAMIELIRTRYSGSLPMALMTGDAMGNQRNIALVNNASHYMELCKGLRMGENQLRVGANPTHENSRTEVNNLLHVSKHNPRYEFKINPDKCPNLVRDCKTVQCDAFGQIVKKNRNDLAQRADHIDCMRYMINLVYRQMFRGR